MKPILPSGPAGTLLRVFFLLLSGLWVSQAVAQTTATCAQYDTISTTGSPAYNVQTNYWNEGTCAGTQCVTINDATGAFGVTEATFNCGSTVASYPSIYYGCHFGDASPGTNLPMLVSNLTCVTSSWNFTPPADTTGDSFDIAYDIWFAPASQPTCADDSGGYDNGAELMIWLNYVGDTPLPTASVTVATGISLAGYTWNIYETPSSTLGWTYMSYQITPNVTSVSNLDLLDFFKDALSRGFIENTWYLAAVEAGDELRTGGVPFVSNSYSVAVNSGCTVVPTSTPGNTSTATPTFTFSSTPSSTASATPTSTKTVTSTPTNIFTNSPTSTPTSTVTYSLTPTPSRTASATPTSTKAPTSTSTATQTDSPTQTSTDSTTPTDTNTATVTPSLTASASPTPTATSSPTTTSTDSPTNTSTNTATSTPTFTPTNSPVATPTHTMTSTPTPTPPTTYTATNTPVYTEANTATSTATTTATNTGTNTATYSATTSPTKTSTATATNSQTNISTATPTNTATNSLTATSTNSPTSTSTLTPTVTPTLTNTETNSPTQTPSSTETLPPTNTLTNSPTGTFTYSMTASPSFTASPTQTATTTNTPTATASATPFLTLAASNSSTSTAVPTSTNSPTLTNSPTVTNNATVSTTPTKSPTQVSTGVVIGIPYPNPVKGSGPVTLPLQLPPGSTFEWSVFTTAFRKVLDIPNPILGDSAVLVWNLDDAWGKPVASGLYYLRVQVAGPVKTSKILKVLVIR